MACQQGQGQPEPWPGRCPGPAPGTGTQTVPAGRFLLDLPGDASARFGRQGFNEAGPFIRTLPVPGPRAAWAVVEAEADALRVPHEEGGEQLQGVLAGRRVHCWFVYYWKDTAFKDGLEIKGYYWLDGLLYVFKHACRPDPAAMGARAERLEALFARMRPRAPLEVPPGPGFCLRGAWFPGPPPARADEHIELLVAFPARPGVSLRFCTDTVGEVVANCPGLLARDAAGSARGRRATRIRARQRPVGLFPGQELVQAVAEPGGTRGWRFAWEYLGRPRDPLAPMLRLELRADGDQELSHSEDLHRGIGGLWESVLGSVRTRENFLRYLRLPEAIRSS